MPTHLTLEPGEYVVDIACPGEFTDEGVGMAPPPMVRTMAIPEDGNYPYQQPSRDFPIGSSGDGVGFPSTYFQYPVYPGSGASVGYTPQPLPPLRGSYMNPGFSGSGIGSGSPSGYMPGGWRPADYRTEAPKPTALAPGIDTPMDWIYGKDTSSWAKYQMSAGQQGEIDTPEDWVYGYDRDAINDPRTNKSISDSLMELPFGVYSWNRTSTAVTG